MLLRTVPLRTKLIASMLLPLGVGGGFLGIQVADEIHQRSTAQAQIAEIERTQAVIAYATAVGQEGLVMGDPAASTDELTEQRAVVDAAWDKVADPALGIDADEITELLAVSDEIGALRIDVGANPFLFRSRLSQPEAQAEATATIARFGQLRSEVLDAFDFDRTLLSDASEAQALNELLLLGRVSANLGAEQATYLAVWSVAGEPLEVGAVDAIRVTATQTNESADSYLSLASTDARNTFRRFIDSPEYVAYQELQNVAMSAQVGDSIAAINLAEVNRAITNANDAFAEIELAKSNEVSVGANQAVERATDNLVRAAALGGGLVFLVTLILLALYQSIRQPLLRLTAQSRRVAEHDLPEIVHAIRYGDADSVGEIETIEAYSNDEIGELVTAFNEMHLAAIELAVEQAGSRRVVAEMFVNLGRRNQKLLNRMLKGLALLERNEPDPDKLAALYQVDHLATRMRRNAESLLILAGATQSRSWDHAVPVYDVINASLAEVENYERVDVNASEGEQIKGEFVADLAHMIAELTENALAFSPPSARVEIVAQSTRRGYAIVVNDRGVGMPAEAMAAANELIAHAGSTEETPSQFLGHYVVGRLAARHGFTVDLLESASGVSARILLPDSVFELAERNDESGEATELVPTPLRTVNEASATERGSADLYDEQTSEASELADEPVEIDAQVNEIVDDSDEPAAHVAPDEEHKVDEEALPVVDASRPLVSPDALPQRRPQPKVLETTEETQPAVTGAFGAQRRKPGANLPVTAMAPRAAVASDLGDPDVVRSSLSGFQSGTNRADTEDES
jgi:signal transduction histidine kinase